MQYITFFNPNANGMEMEVHLPSHQFYNVNMVNGLYQIIQSRQDYFLNFFFRLTYFTYMQFATHIVQSVLNI